MIIAHFDHNMLLIHAQAQTKRKLEKWFIISGDGVRTYV